MKRMSPLPIKHITSNIRYPLRMVDGFSNFTEVLDFIAKLKKRGYSDQDVQTILDKNYLRMFKKVRNQLDTNEWS